MNRKSCVLILMAMAFTQVGISACSGDARPFEEAVEAAQSGLSSLTIRVPEGDLEDVILNIGQRYSLELDGSNADNDTFNVVTSNRRWVVEDPSVVSVDDNGTVTGLNNGTTMVRVSVADVVSNAFTVEVADFPLVAIQRVIGETNIDPCVAEGYRATGTFGDGRERSLPLVVFSATPTETTTITRLSDNQSLLSATTPGPVFLTATVDDISLTESITVDASLTEIALTPSPATVSVGSTVQMIASGTYVNGETTTTRDLTEALVWTISSDDESATISNVSGSRGLVSGVAAGSASISAACGATSVATTLTVSSTGSNTSSLSFNVSESTLLLPLRGGQFALRVSTGSSFSADEEVTADTDFSIIGSTTVLTVGNSGDANGILNPLTVGTTRIRAVYDGRLVAELDVSVTPQ